MWSYKDIDLIEGCQFFLCKLSLINDVLLTKLITHCNTYMYCFFFALLFRVGGGGGTTISRSYFCVCVVHCWFLQISPMKRAQSFTFKSRFQLSDLEILRVFEPFDI